MAFDPKPYTKHLQGKPYLMKTGRVLWFRDEHKDDGAIVTEILSMDPIVVKATVSINGVIIATGHGTAAAKEKAVWSGRELEKAETSAIARALGNAGYGGDADDVVETPKKNGQKPERKPEQKSPPADSNWTNDMDKLEQVMSHVKKLIGDGSVTLSDAEHLAGAKAVTFQTGKAFYQAVESGWLANIPN